MSNSSVIDGFRLEPLPKIGSQPWREGGEAFVYEHPSDSTLLVKVFHQNRKPTPRTGAAAARLRDLWSLSDGLSPSQSDRLSRSFSWPTVLYGSSPDQIEGIGIIKAGDEFWLTYRNIHETITTVQNIAFLGPALSQPSIVSAPYTSTSFEVRIEIAMEFLRTMKVLWNLGFRYCDYSANNLLWAFQPRPSVFVIDVEGCARPGTVENHSPDWEPLTAQLGHTLEADRSQCALLVWRVIAGELLAFPPRCAAGSPAMNLNSRTTDLIVELREKGTASLVEDLLRDLRQYRSSQNETAAFEWAVSTKFANVVLDYAPQRPNPHQANILRTAQEQLTLEEEILALEPRLQKIRLNRLAPIQGFEFDIAAAGIQIPVHQDEDMIRELALDGEFEYIAEMFSTLPNCMPINTVATRSIQAALGNCPRPRITSTRVGLESQKYEWDWPGAAFVNSARVQIIASDGTVLGQALAHRGRDVESVTFPINDAYPEKSKIEVVYGVSTHRNEHVFSPFGNSLPIEVKPRTSPRPAHANRPTIDLLDRPKTQVQPRPSSTTQRIAPASWTQPTTQPPPTSTQIGITTPPPPPPQQGGFGASVKKVFSRIFRR